MYALAAPPAPVLYGSLKLDLGRTSCVFEEYWRCKSVFLA